MDAQVDMVRLKISSIPWIEIVSERKQCFLKDLHGPGLSDYVTAAIEYVHFDRSMVYHLKNHGLSTRE